MRLLSARPRFRYLLNRIENKMSEDNSLPVIDDSTPDLLISTSADYSRALAAKLAATPVVIDDSTPEALIETSAAAYRASLFGSSEQV